MSYKDNDIAPWELLQKKLTFRQLDFVHNMKVLDFGSGNGMTADHFAADNEVTAIEPNQTFIENRFQKHNYQQLHGDQCLLKHLPAKAFDCIFCHNVLEYVKDRKTILTEFSRILKPGGYISVLKHNRAGRVMQMVVLLNNFEHAGELLDKKDGQTTKYGTIRYYEDTDLVKWCTDITIEKISGIRTFWDLQQNQELQKDRTWQDKMIHIESRVSDIEEYREIAFFHHVLLKKKTSEE